MSSYALQILGASLVVTFDTSTPSWHHYVFPIPMGIGFGATITLLLIALISSVPQKGSHLCAERLTRDQATVTGMSYLFRSTGSVIGITATQCVLQNLLKSWLTERIHTPNAQDVRFY